MYVGASSSSGKEVLHFCSSLRPNKLFIKPSLMVQSISSAVKSFTL